MLKKNEPWLIGGRCQKTADHREAAKLLAAEATQRDFVLVFGTDSKATVENYRAALRDIERA